MEIHGRNVNLVFSRVIDGILAGMIPYVREGSRNGAVMRLPGVTTIRYDNPRERVLFNRGRDANPFFHFYEAMWMLAGRNDVDPVKYYVSTIGNYSDDGSTFNGAYGYRWRDREILLGDDPLRYKFVDQLDVLIDHLKRNPGSRRAVLQMWNLSDDLLKIDTYKDVCCNLSVVFEIEEWYGETSHGEEVSDRQLNMTVFNRSNDLIWGTLGANVVHFSFLQEYVADCIGIEVGVYHQVSSNTHIYTNKWTPEDWVERPEKMRTMHDPPVLDYNLSPPIDLPMVHDKATFDREIRIFVNRNYGLERVKSRINFTDSSSLGYKEYWINLVAQPLMNAFHLHKMRNYPLAIEWAKSCESNDWRDVAVQWLVQRRDRWESRQSEGGIA